MLLYAQLLFNAVARSKQAAGDSLLDGLLHEARVTADLRFGG